MKHSIFSNDKTTCKDEIILTVITLIVFVVGLLLIIFRESFGSLNSILATAGAMMIIFVIMMSSIIGYRFATNYKSTDKIDESNNTED